ncbi:Rz1-like lysis system protein LysC [[Erwinia] mediterraneensis]|uniref:Rz1-like lysis system protein LysC n=1 Tax=[Erwinia] mediterraneensis TaxID=2161819 RepID=UPI001F16F76E|nr:Rz1-like lysis system protein LysC [[Erwinia] mediterraneensis]
MCGCAPDRHSPEAILTVNGCPRITRCQLPEAAPRSNGDLNRQLDETEAAWANCADKVDTIVNCQERNDEQAAIFTQSPE